MIKNERQYNITRVQAERFANALKQLDTEQNSSSALHPLLLKAEREAMESQLSDLKLQIAAYESLRDGNGIPIYFESLEDLPRALIRARIGAGWSQRDLAEKLGLKEQQIQRYESTEYASASLDRTRLIANVLGVRSRSTGPLAVSK